MIDAFLNFCIIVAFPFVGLLGVILILGLFKILAQLIEDFCYDYPADVEYFDEDGNFKDLKYTDSDNIINKED